VPTPQLTANKVTVGNTDWGKAMAFLPAGSVDLDVALPPPLLTHRIWAHAVRFVASDVHLERLPTPEQLDLHRTGGNAVDARGRQRRARPRDVTLADQVNAIDIAGNVEMLGESTSYEDTVSGSVRQARSEVLKRIGATATKWRVPASASRA
jgi:uncharacterized protein involved in outer membrane biogenesis